MKQKLILKIRQLRALQDDFGIENILQPSAEDMKKMLSIGFLTEFVSVGLSHLPENERPDLDEMELSELVSYFKTWQSGEAAEGKPPE